MRFKISVKTIQGAILTFSVNKYEIEDGYFVKFLDEKTGRIKRFPSSSCEIQEVKENDSM